MTWCKEISIFMVVFVLSCGTAKLDESSGRQIFDDGDGAVLYNNNDSWDYGYYSFNTEPSSTLFNEPEESYEGRRIKTDSEFEKEIAEVKQTYKNKGFLGALMKYMVRNRAQDREKRDVNYEDLISSDPYISPVEQAETVQFFKPTPQEYADYNHRKRFHPLLVFAK